MAQTMEAVYVEGNVDSIAHTPSGADVAAGQVVDLGTMVGVARAPILDGKLGSLAITGIFSVLKKTGEAWVVDNLIYWDEGTNTASDTVAYSEAVMGKCVKAAATGDVAGLVALMPSIGAGTAP